eukprot:s236_g22.t1
MVEADSLSVAMTRFGYAAGQLPAPTAIYARREALIAEIRNKLVEGEVALQQQLSRQQEQLEALQKQQNARFRLALDCQVKADEYSLSKRHNEQLMQLQQRAQARRAQLEQQATSLVLEFQQRKLQEEFLLQQKEIQRQHEQEQSRLAKELQKLGTSGAEPLESLLNPSLRWSHEKELPRSLSHRPSHLEVFSLSPAGRTSSFQAGQINIAHGQRPGSMQLPMNRSSSWAGHDLAPAVNGKSLKEIMRNQDSYIIAIKHIYV